jgi:hypothetical protein
MPGDWITPLVSPAVKEVKTVNIELLERPVEPASAIAKGT